MARIDHEKNLFIDRDGNEFDLAAFKRVMVPRTAGGYSPGWIFQEAFNGFCICLLEEGSDKENMVRTKIVEKVKLLPFAEGMN